MGIISPVALWENYDRTSPPRETIIKQSADGLDKHLYFNGMILEGSHVRVYARLVLPKGIEKPPVIILADSAEKDIDSTDASFFINNGFAVLIVDYFGSLDSKARYAIYPKTIDAYWEKEPEKIKQPPADVKTSCWYYFTTCILHAVTYLEKCEAVNARKIGIFGVDQGAALVFKCASVPAIKAGVTFFSGDPVGDGPEFLAYKAALDSRAYVKSGFPILINASTNCSDGSFDYLNELYSISESAAFCVNANTDRAVAAYQRDNIPLWFYECFKGSMTMPEKNCLTVFGSGGAVYAEVAVTGAKSVSVYYAEDNPAALRHWKKLIPPKAGENRHLVKLDIFDTEIPIWVFAKVQLANGFTFSTSAVLRQPLKLGANKSDYTNSRLLYRVEDGTAGFLLPSGDFYGDRKLNVCEGPLGLEGLCGDTLITFKAGDAKYKGSRGGLLQLILSSSITQEVEIGIIERTGAQYYAYRRVLFGEWTTLTLSDEDFKSLKGTPDFSKTAGIVIKGREVLLNSMLWV